MTIVEALTLVALVFGPVIAVIITLKHEDRKDKHAAKERLFVTLMAHRKSVPLSLDWARALNLIDAVYESHPTVVKAWHEFYAVLNTAPLHDQNLDYRRTALLSEMAKVLGYSALQQIDIERFYNATAHTSEGERNYQLQTELISLLQKVNMAIDQYKAEQAAKAAQAPQVRQ